MSWVETVVPGSFGRAREVRNLRNARPGDRRLRGLAGQWLFGGAMAALLYIGWINREQQIWVPDHGFGYGLGVVGGTLMLLLLLYPVQKRFLILAKWLKVRHFFRLHMVFGILGPVLILLHSSYRLGSINGQIALFSMLIVVFSGLVGRYIYKKIHHGLYGRRASLEDLRIESREVSAELDGLLHKASIKQQLVELEQKVDLVPKNFFSSLLFWSRTRASAAKSYRLFDRQLLEALKVESTENGWDRTRLRRQRRESMHLLRTHKRAVIRMLEVRFYERMFSLWHILHFPLFIMMVVTGIAHVYAVHVY